MNRKLYALLVLFFVLMCTAPGCSSESETEAVREIQEELRIGSQMGGGPDMFGNIGRFSIGPDGRVYVYDRSDQEIRVFDREGRFVHRFGREGEGPGEFGGIWAMAWDSDDHLWIIDNRNIRYSIFNTDGVLIEDYPCPIVTRDTAIAGFDRSGYFYDQTAYVDSGNVYRRKLIRMTRKGETIGEIPLPEFTMQALQMGGMRFPIPFSREMVTCFDPSGYIWHGVSDRYEIFRMTFDGDQTMVISSSPEGIPLSVADRDSVNSHIDQLKARFRMATVPGNIIPQVKPIFDGIYLNQITGEVWVKLIDYTDEGTVFDIYLPDGRFKESVRCRIPIHSSPVPVILGDEIWFITEDEMGAEYVVRGVLTEQKK